MPIGPLPQPLADSRCATTFTHHVSFGGPSSAIHSSTPRSAREPPHGLVGLCVVLAVDQHRARPDSIERVAVVHLEHILHAHREARAPPRLIGDLARAVARVERVAELRVALAVAARAAADVEDAPGRAHMPQESLARGLHVDGECPRAEGGGVGGVPVRGGGGTRGSRCGAVDPVADRPGGLGVLRGGTEASGLGSGQRGEITLVAGESLGFPLGRL